MEPKPFGSIYYEYRILLRIHYVLPIQTYLMGITLTFEINMWFKAVQKWASATVQFVTSLLAFLSYFSSSMSFLP